MFKVILLRALLGLVILGAIALVVFAWEMAIAFIQNFDLHLFLQSIGIIILCYILGHVLEWWWNRDVESF